MRVAVLVLAGCVTYDETMHVTLRDPAAVAVSAQTPCGVQPLIAQGAEGSASVPATSPPYNAWALENPLEGAGVVRRDGALIVTCAWCAFDTTRTVVARTGEGGVLEMPGSPERIRRAGDTLRMDVAYVAPVPCVRHRGWCPGEAFDVLVDTPRDNVVRIDYSKRVAKSHGELTGAKIALGAGIVFAGVGLAGISYVDIAGEAPSATAKWAIGGVCGAFVVLGGVFAALGASTLLAHDSDQQVAVP